MQLITHTERVFSLPHFLSSAECSELVELAEASGFESANVRTAAGQVAMPSIRNNERTMFENRAWVAKLWDRLSQTSLPTIDGQVAVGFPKDLRFYKYLSGQRFKLQLNGPE